MRPFVAVLVAGLLVLTAACSDDAVDVGAGDGSTPTGASDGAASTVPGRPPELTGTITAVTPFVPVTEHCTPAEDLDPDGAVSSDDPPVCTDPDNDVLGTVLLEEAPGAQEGRKIAFTVTTATVLAGRAELSALAVGQHAEGWTPGPCRESYPEQCTAEAIRVTG